MGLSRRDLVLQIAAAGGYGAALAAMQALGIAPASAATPMARDRASGAGRRVIVLGGGVAGLVAAFELDQAGFDVLVLEARGRAGGRNWSLRGGDVLEATRGPAQTVAFDPGFYFNAGPARLPSTHHTILGYCRELGVPLEVEVNASRSAFVVGRDGSRIRMSQVVNDTRGRVSEMLAKAVAGGRLDDVVSAGEKRDLLAFLRAYGALDLNHDFKGTSRSGFLHEPGAADAPGEAVAPLDLATLTQPRFYLPHTFEETNDMQPTMFQPVGGMDQIPKAFQRALGARVRLGAEVQSVRNAAGGVEIVWRDQQSRARRIERADFAVSALPAPLLARVRTNFSPAFAAAIARVRTDDATKLAWQAPRFWERDDHIYGGLAYVEHPVRFLWYPSNELNSEEGVLVGCYNTGEAARASARQSIEERAAASRAAIEMAHPGRGALLKHPVSMVWRDQFYNQGAWGQLGPGSPDYRLLNEPDGNVHLAGDWLTHIVGWQEGAALSAQRAVRAIVARAGALTARRDMGRLE